MICNPPFYESKEEVERTTEDKEFDPMAVRVVLRSWIFVSLPQACTGADIEMITPGGERAFVTRMVYESGKVRNKCKYVGHGILCTDTDVQPDGSRRFSESTHLWLQSWPSSRSSK